VIAEGDERTRNLAGARLAEFHFCSPALAGVLQCDPHPGNYMMLGDGRLGVIDFGACAPFPDGLPPVLGRMLRLVADEDFEHLTELMYDNGFVLDGYTVSPQEVADYLRPVTDPLHSPTFHFTREWLQRVAVPALDVNGHQFKTGRTMNLPAQYVMIMRVLVGSVGIACQLDAEADYRRIMSDWLPGFADPIPAR
jgi:predicted unusual protein kinase regulating ubiquinone biosynthesis (AarF/ABC1/UbiB family)